MPIIPLIGYKIVKDHMEAKEAQKDLTPEQAAALQAGKQPENLNEYQTRVIAAAQAQHARDQGKPHVQNHEHTKAMTR